MRHRLSERAAIDLGRIFEHSFDTFGLAQADRYSAGLFERLDIICENPDIGRLFYSQATLKVRRVLAGSHHIYYTLSKTEIIVGRILHTRMDTDNVLNQADFL